jgi:hypothetical protein
LQRLERLLLPVAFDVEGSDMKQVGVVTEQAEPVVAPLAQQTANLPAGMVVVQVVRLGVGADCAEILLLVAQSIDRFTGQPIATQPIGFLAQPVVTGLASRAEARR